MSRDAARQKGRSLPANKATVDKLILTKRLGVHQAQVAQGGV